MKHKWEMYKGPLCAMMTQCTKCGKKDQIGADFCDSATIVKELERIGKRDDCRGNSRVQKL